jgi:hypothetical protein
MNPHTPKGASTSGGGVPVESRWNPECLKSDCKGQKPMAQGVFHTIEKLLKHRCLKMGLHDPFGHLKHKLWLKEGSGIDPISLFEGGVRHTVGNISMRSTNLF